MSISSVSLEGLEGGVEHDYRKNSNKFDKRISSEDIKSVIEVMKKEAPYDETSIKQTFLWDE